MQRAFVAWPVCKHTYGWPERLTDEWTKSGHCRGIRRIVVGQMKRKQLIGRRRN